MPLGGVGHADGGRVQHVRVGAVVRHPERLEFRRPREFSTGDARDGRHVTLDELPAERVLLLRGAPRLQVTRALCEDVVVERRHLSVELAARARRCEGAELVGVGVEEILDAPEGDELVALADLHGSWM